jgi:CheY-like chemotaxis protein
MPLLDMAHFLEERGIAVLLDRLTAVHIDNCRFPVMDLDELGAHVDLAIVIGGDGTMLNIARTLAPQDVPLVGVNQGRLGFLTDISTSTMVGTTEAMLDGNYVTEDRMLLDARVYRGKEKMFEALAFNDVVVSKGTKGGMIELEFRIRDTGIGIPADKRSRLFKAFSQVDSSTTRRYGGTGLGLVISERLVGLMEGSIAVESESGVGTQFIFTIRCQANQSTVKLESDHNLHIEGKTILVVDDNAVNQKVARMMLERVGFTVLTAADGREGLEVFQRRAEEIAAQAGQARELGEQHGLRRRDRLARLRLKEKAIQRMRIQGLDQKLELLEIDLPKISGSCDAAIFIVTLGPFSRLHARHRPVSGTRNDSAVCSLREFGNSQPDVRHAFLGVAIDDERHVEGNRVVQNPAEHDLEARERRRIALGLGAYLEGNQTGQRYQGNEKGSLSDHECVADC